ncbi:insulinase (Peptidase family M16) family protein [Artemisia annua]|uniref:Insulinase (Peptidase family M16) family protein n=1 Tax=Artemisia annua TaxID=35608 RepID=A0A2U1QK71_ARTAN|nr:insulinase (Peptidase family M16) family protein [Artemisia annua]
MCVGMGSFRDPLEAQGLAHFLGCCVIWNDINVYTAPEGLEHMLFMGSAEFPDENEYDSYLSKHGGSSNAYTEVEHTCYHFEVKPEFLEGALRRFSQFFVSPLVKTEAMDREVLAVDSEFNQALQSDLCRLQQLQCHTAAPGHAFNQFFWGNKKSLVDAMEKGINLRDQIFKLYNDFYHGGSMKLVIIGGESLDVLESWVQELFSKVKASNEPKVEVKPGLPVWSAGKMYRLEAVKDVNMLELAWTLPCLRKDYTKKAEDYLSHLIGHEGRGSLLFFLKAKGWATSISAGVGDDGMQRSSVAYVFDMCIHLTDSGLDKINEIIGFVYQYIKLLRQVPPQEWIYRELQDVANMDFTFAEEQPQDEYAADISANMLIYPPEHTIYGDYAYKVWDEEMIKHLLTFFTPDNMRTDILSKSFNKSQDVQCEPWFGSHYIEENISPSLLELWRDPPEIDASLHLPIKNEFIPQDFSVRANSVSCDSTGASPPKCILDEPLMKLWYKLDTTFKFPRANTYFRITLNGAYRGLKNVLLTELYMNLLKDKLNDIVYQASVAKLETSISLASDKLELKVYGFNDKLPVLLSKVLETAKSFSPTDDRFAVIKEDMERNLRNANMKPLNHASYLRLQVLFQSFWDFDEKLGLLNDLSLADLKAFIPELFSQLYIEGICHGNLLEEEAKNVSNIFKKYFSVPPVPPNMRHKESILCLPLSADLVRDVPVKNKLDTNSVVELYYQIEPEVDANLAKSKALIDLLDEIIEEPFFNQLRTKEQLGYVVDCSPRLYIEGICHGNLLEEEAKNVSNIFKKYFSVPPVPPNMRHKESILCLPLSADLVRDVPVKNKLDTNSVVELYYQIEPEVDANLAKSKALIDLLDEIIEEPFFNQLRTKEQLGYVVDCSPRVTYRILGLCFRVQSSEYSPVYLQGRIDKFINEMDGLLSEVDDESFQNFKSGLIAKLLEKDPSLAYETNRYWGQIVDQRYMFDLSAKEAEAVKSLEKTDVSDWYNTYLRKSSPKCRRLAVRVWGCNTNINESKTESTSAQLYIEGICHGNLLEEEAKNVSNIFKKYFSVPPVPPNMRHKESILCLPLSADLVRDVPVKNKLDTNSVVELYYQIEPEVDANLAKSKALIDLLDEIIEEPFFNQLRTKEQLGYVVDCSPRVTYRILGLCFRVQSSEYSPVYLQGRIDKFINEMDGLLSEVDDESFQNFKSGLIAKLLEKDPSLAYETNRYWGQIVDQRYMFDLSAKEAEAVKSLEKTDVSDWYNTYLRKSSPKCRRLAVRVWGCNTNINESRTESTSAQVINDPITFKASSTFYPASC